MRLLTDLSVHSNLYLVQVLFVCFFSNAMACRISCISWAMRSGSSRISKRVSYASSYLSFWTYLQLDEHRISEKHPVCLRQWGSQRPTILESQDRRKAPK